MKHYCHIYNDKINLNEKYVKCNCKNDLKYKHQHCINEWINHKKDNVDMYKCE